MNAAKKATLLQYTVMAKSFKNDKVTKVITKWFAKQNIEILGP